MNINISISENIVANDWTSKLLKFISKIPLTELLVGVVVPILAAWISYELAERATRRKEYNRLFIQIELVKKELLNNKNALNGFISKYEEKIKLTTELEFPTVFCKNLLIEVLEKLDKIKGEYLHFSNTHLFDKPKYLYILSDKIERVDKELEVEEVKYYDDEYMESKQKSKVSKLKEEKEEYINEFKKNQDRDIYKEFLYIQYFIENNSFENMFDKSNSTNTNFEVLRYIYNSIKEFNCKQGKNKSDVAILYKELVLFKISSNIISEDKFDQDTFDLYYKGFEKYEDFKKLLLDKCERYYKMIAAENFIENYKFQLFNQKWNDNSGEMVLLSDSELYILINTLYEEVEEFKINFEEGKNGNFNKTYEYSKTMVSSIENIINNLEKHQKKIKKWCK